MAAVLRLLERGNRYAIRRSIKSPEKDTPPQWVVRDDALLHARCAVLRVCTTQNALALAPKRNLFEEGSGRELQTASGDQLHQ
jgi:hypothetical protein